MKKHYSFLAALAIGLVIAYNMSYHDTRLAYTRTILSEKIEESVGYGSSAKKDIMSSRERFGQGSVEETPVGDQGRDEASTTTVEKLKGGNVYYGSDAGGESAGDWSSSGGARRSEEVLVSGAYLWDERFSGLFDVFNGSSEASCGGGNVFLLAVVGDDFLWERVIRVLDDGVLVEDSSENASIWVKVSGDAAEKLYQRYVLGEGKSALYAAALSSWLSGELKLYPIMDVKDVASCVLSKP
ncbi:MAG: hypothetical protein ABH834_04455 [Candidatus Altiarchaeota archaeon]